ncbi:MAG: dihydrolipoamide acetyltransferase family protein [Planctomycetota bacterium]|nr:dihydrolipoamide acetyltransferase family protein [Planctomycetota bacterium]
MPIEITMPRLSDTMEKGTIIKWHVAEGDQVGAGDVLADVETDKATMEMQSFDDGTIQSLAVSEGQAVDVGTVVAVLLEEDESPGDAAPSTPVEPASTSDGKSSADSPAVAVGHQDMPASETPTPTASLSAAGHLRISPVARRLADAHGIDPTSLVGSGTSGRIVKRDILAAIGTGDETRSAVPPSATPSAPSAPPVPAAQPVSHPPAPVVSAAPIQATPVSTDEVAIPGALQSHQEAVSGMRQTIAQRLVESKQSIPHYQVSMTLDVEPLLSLRKSLNSQLAGTGSKISVNDLIVRACGLAMYANPLMNASWAGDSIIYHGDVNIGVAIALPPERGGGLVVATIRNVDRKSIRIISAETKALSEKARTRGLTVEEMSDATFTISNLGMFGIDNFTAIINPPNSAILAVGAALEKPIVRNGELTIGREMTVTLSNDHRVVDGATAAQYLVTLREFIENPAQILI